MQIPKILLVNDDGASLFALQSLLMVAPRQPDYAPITGTSGHEALGQVSIHEFAHPRSSAVPIRFQGTLLSEPVPAAQIPERLLDAVQGAPTPTRR